MSGKRTSAVSRGEEPAAALAELVGDEDILRPVFGVLRDLAKESLKIFIPDKRLASGVSICGKYNGPVHAKLCRLKLLGVSDASAARALGMAPTTVRNWREKYPQLACDMDSAAELANVHAAAILKALMIGGGPTAFNAVRFYLTTHSPEFREPTAVPPAADIQVTIQSIRQQIYGLPPKGAYPLEPQEREGLPLVDVALLPPPAALPELESAGIGAFDDL